MIELLKEFVRGIFVFLLVDTMVSQLTSHTKYYPYIRFFMGIFLVLLLASPIFSILNQTDKFSMNFLFEKSRFEMDEVQMERKMALLLKSQEKNMSKEYEKVLAETIDGWAKECKVQITDMEVSFRGTHEIKKIKIESEGDKKGKEKLASVIEKRMGVDGKMVIVK